MKTLFKIIAVFILTVSITSCSEDTVYPYYTLSSEIIVPDSLRVEHRKWVQKTIRAASQHMAGGDYEHVDVTIIQANRTADELFGERKIVLSKHFREGWGNMIIVKPDEMTDYEKQIFEKDPKNTIIVGRDKIRELLFGYTESNMSEYYLREDLRALEKEVSRYQDTLIYDSLERNKTVIVDNTHLKTEYLKSYTYWNVPIEVVFTEASKHLEVCAYNDKHRSRSVGEAVIKKQYQQYKSVDKDVLKNYVPKKINNSGYKNCILVDIDGTIAQMEGRSPYDWKRVGEDSVIDSIAYMVKRIDECIFDTDPEIIFVTGRDEICREETLTWLNENGLNGTLIHRANKDSRADWIVKEEIWDYLNNEGYSILAMFDDRLQVVRRARALGYKVLNVEYNNF